MNTTRSILFFIIAGALSVPSCEPDKKMAVETGEVSNISTTTADVTGEIIDVGEGATQHGHCYGTTASPLITGTKTALGTAVKGDFTSNLTGLEPETKYYVRAYCSLGGEAAYGSEISFTTASAALPEITTTAITSITKNSAVSGGNITTGGGTSVTARGVCWSISTGPTTDNDKTTNSSGTGSFSSNITGLTSNTLYYVRAYATNSGGTAYGNELSFTTSPEFIVTPTVTTSEVNSVTSNSAVSGGDVTSEGGSPVTAKGVCWSTSVNPTIVNSKTNDGTGTGSFVSNITNLFAGTKYYVRAYATNSTGASYGEELSFTTSLVVPTLTTIPATSITKTTATSGGDITNSGGSPVIVRGVCWSTSRNPDVDGNRTSDGPGIGTYSSSLTGMTGNTTYYIRAYATNSIGTGYGNELNFLTAAIAPTITTKEVTDITATTASSGGNVVSDGGTAVTFRGVCWNITANPTISDSKTSDGTGGGSFTSSVTGLTPGTTYHVRAYATNSEGTSYGADVTFTAGAVLPALTTTAISAIKSTTATSGGNITAENGSPVTARGVCWSTSVNPTTADPKTSDGSGTGSFASSITGLTPCTEYHVRAYATNSAGTAYGEDVPFTSGIAVVTVTTTAISEITSSTASSGGNITGTCATTVTTRGVCWSASSNPTTTGSKTDDGTGSGTFASSITGLTPNTTYHVRAYATNSAGTAYGEDVSFTTGTISPSASTSAASSIGAINATLNGTVNPNNASTTVIFEYGTSTSYDLVATADQSPVTGTASVNVTATISGLTAETNYHFRIKAVNAAGTVYGDDMIFKTRNATITDADGNVYNTITIGTQLWMAENLKTTKYRDGTSIPNVTGTAEWLALTGGAYCDYGNNSSNSDIYGRLYNWYTVINGHYLCPAGWRVPTDGDWTTLISHMGGESIAGGKLKETGTAHWSNPNTDATDESGFTALPGGYRYTDGTFHDKGSYGIWWSSTYCDVNTRWYRSMSYDNSNVIKDAIFLLDGLSIRCIQGEDQVLPLVTTGVISAVTSATAGSGGYVTSDGGMAVTAGVCWSTNPNPTITDDHTIDGNAEGSFTANITGLLSNTTYYVKAYATNGIGTAYGDEISLTTLAVVSTSAISNITATTASGGGSVTADGTENITARGVCWSTNENPTTSNNKTIDGSGTGDFTSNLSSLSDNTLYYVRAYATNKGGTAYGDQISFTTDPATVTDIDGNIYNVIRIGTQLWTKENLKTTKFNDNFSIPLVEDNFAWSMLITSGYCWYNNDGSTFKDTYGALYNWWSINTGKLCPTGWHVPNDGDWGILRSFLGGSSIAGGKLKETGTTHWDSPNTGATNESGFTALPGGERVDDGSYTALRYWGELWSSTYLSGENGSNVSLSYASSDLYNATNIKKYGYSIRCIRDY